MNFIAAVGVGLLGWLLSDDRRDPTSLYNVSKEAFHNFKQSRVLASTGFDSSLSYAPLWRDDLNLPSFQYTPISDPREIRLIKVTCEGNDRHFRSDFVHVNVDTPSHAYVAISYTWDDPQPVSTIPCGSSQHLHLTQSVSNILQNLLEPGETILLWIDALCIDQKNVSERESQVGLMRDIYRNAVQVAIMLGEPIEETATAMDFMVPLRAAMENIQQRGQLLSLERVVSETGVDYPSAQWTALRRFLQHRWFTRIWVVQEYAVGSDPIFIGPNRAVKSSDLVAVLELLTRNALFLLVGAEHTRPNQGHRSPAGFVDFPYVEFVRELTQKGLKQGKLIPSLEFLLPMFRTRDATDKRDKIIALLGIAEDGDDEALRPNYRIPVEDVYLQFAGHLLSRADTTYMLHHAGIGDTRALSTLPSWVPDWSTVYRFGIYGTPSAYMEYRTGTYTLPRITYQNGSKTIKLSGIVVDSIDVISRVSQFAAFSGSMKDDEIHLYAEQILPWVKDTQGALLTLSTISDRGAWKSVPYPATNQTLYDAYCETLIGNKTLFDPRVVDSTKLCRLFEKWMTILPRHLQRDSTLDYEELKDVEHFDKIFTQATAEKRFFTTRSGLIGLSSPGIQPKDLVVAFAGGAAPFIIRKNNANNRYILVKEAYIHGLMKGRGVDMDNLTEIELE
ncbi:hypothetical protein PV08_04027 [Exophiala spinifera]|uniref:Heterokaryon incompatibility domain-containing protein n=1 Tax=Exophiala spinifera TaxID=91928 RepID=A0A0D1ZVV5_9EURO|nr:uncharacterized protein PV08_04027 [Exophiala spinifera]KIW16837.1 hypothetical protein PV08_04027 [Exophiala spinifera]